MKKFFIRLVTLFGAITLISSVYGFFNTGKSYELIKLTKKFGERSIIAPSFPATIRIQGKNWTCTAFVIDSNYAATAAHCLASEGHMYKGDIKVFSYDKETKTIAKAAGFADENDFGLIVGDFRDFMFVTAEWHDFPFLGQHYTTCGYPYQEKHLICNPFVPATNRDFSIVGAGFLVPGMSGGPVVDLDTGIVVGINYAAVEGGVLVHPLQGFLGAFNLE